MPDGSPTLTSVCEKSMPDPAVREGSKADQLHFSHRLLPAGLVYRVEDARVVTSPAGHGGVKHRLSHTLLLAGLVYRIDPYRHPKAPPVKAG